MNVDQIDGIKTKRYRSKGYSDWVGKNLICCECGIKDETIVAHHVRGAESGIGMMTSWLCHYATCVILICM